MARAVALLAALGDRIAMALPGDDSVAAFEAVAAEGFVLERRGLDSESAAGADQVAAGCTAVGLDDVLAHADRETRPFAGALGGRAHGYTWNAEDGRTKDWWPQGITGSADAHGSGRVAGREVHAVSWYSKRGQGVRLSFVDVAAGRYRHVLCVRTTGGQAFAPVKVHAGGIAWVENLMYVADTRHGLRVFDTDRVLRVPETLRGAAHGYAHVMPQVGAYLSTGGALSFSFVSLDRSGSAALVVGEYEKAPGGRLVRWPIDLSSGLLASERATGAYRAPVDRLQGAASVADHVVASSSRRGGRLYVGRGRERSARHVWWPYLPEDLHLSTAAGELYSVTEAPGMRMVFGVRTAALGL